jgi:hypothetical protein
MWTRTAARISMSSLTTVEREAITDSVLKIQSIQASLSQVDEAKIPDADEIKECLNSAHGKLRGVLKQGPGKKASRTSFRFVQDKPKDMR